MEFEVDFFKIQLKLSIIKLVKGYSEAAILALLLALVSRCNVRQVKVPMFEAQSLSRGIVHNVCASAVARFRSRVLSPKPNVERR